MKEDRGKYQLRRRIEQLRDRSRWSDNSEDRVCHSALADAAAKDYRELHGEEYVEGGR